MWFPASHVGPTVKMEAGPPLAPGCGSATGFWHGGGCGVSRMNSFWGGARGGQRPVVSIKKMLLPWEPLDLGLFLGAPRLTLRE